MKKNKLNTAILASVAGIAGVAGVANAVYVNQDGLGQVLIYPYYTVNNGLNTTLSVVNTTQFTKAVKVRFLEGDNSREVLDFNLYMSPYDVWAAALVPATSTYDGNPSGQIVFDDKSCTPFLNSGQEFLPWEIYADASRFDNVNNSMERSTEGHFEIIEMATLDPSFGFGADAVHVNGVPADCAQLTDNWRGGGTWDEDVPGGDSSLTDFGGPQMMLPMGGLFGSASILNVPEGTDVSYNAIALEDFWNPNALVSDLQHTEPGSVFPSLNDAFAVSTVFNNGVALNSSWLNNFEAVSAVFMHDMVYNTYALDAAINAKTEWVLTFPTKRFHVDVFPATDAIEPFTDVWNGVDACEVYTFTVFDREEGDVPLCELEPNNPLCDDGGISPPAPGGQGPGDALLCWESNVLEFLNGSESTGSSAILGSDNLSSAQTFENGWASLSFAQMMDTSATGPGYNGLPVTGFAVEQYTNTAAQPGLLAQYAGLFNHKYRTTSN